MGINESFKSGMRIIGPLIASTMITFDLILPWYFTGFILGIGVLIAILLSISGIVSDEQILLKVEEVTAL